MGLATFCLRDHKIDFCIILLLEVMFMFIWFFYDFNFLIISVNIMRTVFCFVALLNVETAMHAWFLTW